MHFMRNTTLALAISLTASGGMAQTAKTTSTVAGLSTPVDNTAATANWTANSNYWEQHYGNEPYYNNSQNYTRTDPSVSYSANIYNQPGGVSYSALNQAARSVNTTPDWDQSQRDTIASYDRAYIENRR